MPVSSAHLFAVCPRKLRRGAWLVALVALAAVVVSTAGATHAEDSLPAKEKFHLYLLVGQSNMAGRGRMTEQDKQPDPRILMFTKDHKWKPAVDPLHFDKPVAGVGLGRSFARVIAEQNPDVTIGLIPCAVGGSPIASWEPGGYHASTKTHPYDDMLARVKVALPAGTLKGILWHQGESDSQPASAKVYEEKLHSMIARMRKELDAPEAPFIVGQMGVFAERPWDDAKKMVDAAHQTLPKKVSHTAFVSAEGLGHKGDEVHFSADAYRELGKRYAKAYLELTK
ncbi:MAG: sialate O-acetylesterase [Pirellulaceae bacterium]